MSDTEGNNLVVDVGSYEALAGFSGDDAPRCVTPNWILELLNEDENDCNLVGDQASKMLTDWGNVRNDEFHIKYPMDDPYSTNWDDMEKIFKSIWKELCVDPSEISVMFCEPFGVPPSEREKLTEIMMENFGLERLYVGISAVMSLFASGRGSGLIIDSGHTQTHTAAIYQGELITESLQRSDIAGRSVTQELRLSVAKLGVELPEYCDFGGVYDVKKNVCYCALDYEGELTKFNSMSYDLPDGRIVTLDQERYQSTEGLFDFKMFDSSNESSIQDMVWKGLQACDNDTLSLMYCSVILSGGNTMITGFEERLGKELRARVPATYVCKVVSPPERKYSSWIGGSILSSLTTFRNMWITKSQYEEFGAKIVNKRCESYPYGMWS